MSGGRTAVAEASRFFIHYDTVRGRVTAVNGVDLRVYEGETLALVGESGCGKSTLGRGLMGLLPSNATAEGEVRIRGRDLLALRKDERRQAFGKEVAMIFQDPMTRLDPLMRIDGHFYEVFRAHGVKLPKEEMRRRAAKALADVGVPATRLQNYPHEVSGGQRQRIMIALGLVLDPALLIADEPTTALDVIVEAQIMGVLQRLKRERRMGILMVTHNLALVADVADRVVVMYAADLVEVGTVHDIFDRPSHPYTQGLLASTIHLGTTDLVSIPGAPPPLVRPPSGCRFHPRCPRAHEICRDRRPPLAEMGDGHRALCWFPGPENQVRPQAPEHEWGPVIVNAARAEREAAAAAPEPAAEREQEAREVG